MDKAGGSSLSLFFGQASLLEQSKRSFFLKSKAVLALENGMIFEGTAIGVDGLRVGEVVFNTSITGYQEILTDPSYARQIITLTHPHIGNTGITPEDNESPSIWASGLVVRDLSEIVSNWRSKMSLAEFLVKNETVAISGVDTRQLTSVLRETGSLKGAILSGKNIGASEIERAVNSAREFSGLVGVDLAREVTSAQPAFWNEGPWNIKSGFTKSDGGKHKVVALDFGVKRNILRLLVSKGCSVNVVPAQTSIDAILEYEPDGVFLSNGPGDPEPCDYAIAVVKNLLSKNIPIFGICLGLQILGIAAGMKSIKMLHGHHGANHPVQNLETGEVLITSQNHGFCLDDSRVPKSVEITHRSLFDNSVQGVRLKSSPAFGFQGHPEASPGPHDAQILFDDFVTLMESKNA